MTSENPMVAVVKEELRKKEEYRDSQEDYLNKLRAQVNTAYTDYTKSVNDVRQTKAALAALTALENIPGDTEGENDDY